MESLDLKILIIYVFVSVCKLFGKDICNDIVYIIKYINIFF